MAGKKIVKRIKESLSLGSKSPSSHAGPSSSTERPVLSASIGDASFSEFLETELKEDYHKLVATSFAEFIKGDTSEQNIDFDHHYQFLGYKQKVKAVELLLKRFPELKPDVFSQTGKNKTGRKRNTFIISFDQYEELLLSAQTAEGDMARKAVLAIKNAVFKFIKIEKNRDQQQLEDQKLQAQRQLQEQMTKLAIEEGKRSELEKAQSDLHNALQAEKERLASLKALRDNDDEPNQTAYLMESGVFKTYIKIGKTGEEGEKRKKELQTGNPEEITVFFERKCIDSKLVERCLHHMFRWYKRRGEWYEIDKERAIYYMRLMTDLLDGTRRIEHESMDPVDACRGILANHGLDAPVLQQVVGESENDDWKPFRQQFLIHKPGKCQWTDLYKALNHWLDNGPNNKTHKETTKRYFVKHLGPLPETAVTAPTGGSQFRGWNNWHLDYDLG